jgi:hypothetical protein
VSLSFGSPYENLNTLLIFPTPPTCCDHHFLLEMIILIIFGDKLLVLSSSLCNFLHPPVVFSLLSPNIPLSTLFSNALSLCSSANVKRRTFLTQTKLRPNHSCRKQLLLKESLRNRSITHGECNYLRFVLCSRNVKCVAVQCFVHKTPLLNPILSQFNPVHTRTPCFYSIRHHFILHLPPGLPSCHFDSEFVPPTTYTFVIYYIRAACPAHISTVPARICVYGWGR